MISATKVKSKLEERLKTHFKKGDTNVMAHFTTHHVHVTQLQTSGLGFLNSYTSIRINGLNYFSIKLNSVKTCFQLVSESQ